jgi:hypothetical protein
MQSRQAELETARTESTQQTNHQRAIARLDVDIIDCFLATQSIRPSNNLYIYIFFGRLSFIFICKGNAPVNVLKTCFP